MRLIKMTGGLGNQMFIYAFFVSMKRRFPSTRIDLSDMVHYHAHHGYELHRIFDLPHDEFCINQKVKKAVEFLFFKTILERKQDQTTLRAFWRKRLWPLIYFKGFYQSERYFADCADTVRRLFTFDEPIASVDTAAFRFYKQKDTLWVEEPYLFLPQENDMRSYMLYAEWHPGEKYRLEADSNAVVSILGKMSAPIKKEISATPEEEFSSLFVQLILPDTGAVVQLLNNTGKVIRSVRAVNNRVDFFYLNPGDYYLRLFLDRNGDGLWTTGCYEDGLQPEEVFYFPKPLTLRARWEVEQDWEPRSIPLNKQKPAAITKQKPDSEKRIKRLEAQREYEREQRNRKRR